MLNNTKLQIFLCLGFFTVGIFFIYAGNFSQNKYTEIKKIMPSTLGMEGESVIIEKVIDGDTFIIQGGDTVRMVGIDTPETLDPKRPVGCFGKEASNESKNLLTGKNVILQKDISDTDKYGRLLRLVFLPLEDGRILFVNDYLIRQGFAKNYEYKPDLKFSERFKEAQNQAEQENKGLWNKCR